MPLFDQAVSNPNVMGTLGQGLVNAKNKLKGALTGTMAGNTLGIKPPQDAPPAPMVGAPQVSGGDRYASFFPTPLPPTPAPEAHVAPPANVGPIGPPNPGGQPQFAGFGHFGTNASGPPAPPPGEARAWSSQGPATANTQTQNFSVPIGPVAHPGEFRPAPIGKMGAGAGDSGTGGGGGSTAADTISRFYDSIGLPLHEAISGAQRDEALARGMATQRFGSEQGTVGLQQAMMQHNLTAAPQNEIARRISELSTANLYNPTPQGAALIKQYIQQLQQMGGGAPQAQAGTGEQQEGAVPGTTPTPAAHPGVGGMLHSFLHGALPAAAGAGGWAAGAALAPETGFASLAVPAAASLATYFGGNKLMNTVDPGGAEAATEHPVANIAGQVGGGLAGYRGFGALGSQGAKSTGGPAGTLAAEVAGTPTTQNMAAQAEQARFAGAPTNIRPKPGFASQGAASSYPAGMGAYTGEYGATTEPRTSVTGAGTPQQTPAQGAPFSPSGPPLGVPASQDPAVAAAVNAFKQPAPAAQMTQPAPGMQSTAMPSPRVEAMRVAQPAERQQVATNPVQLPQQPVTGVPQTLNPGMLSQEVLKRIIGDPRLGPAITHDPALMQLIQHALAPAQ